MHVILVNSLSLYIVYIVFTQGLKTPIEKSLNDSLYRMREAEHSKHSDMSSHFFSLLPNLSFLCSYGIFRVLLQKEQLLNMQSKNKKSALTKKFPQVSCMYNLLHKIYIPNKEKVISCLKNYHFSPKTMIKKLETKYFKKCSNQVVHNVFTLTYLLSLRPLFISCQTYKDSTFCMLLIVIVINHNDRMSIMPSIFGFV